MLSFNLLPLSKGEVIYSLVELEREIGTPVEELLIAIECRIFLNFSKKKKNELKI